MRWKEPVSNWQAFWLVFLSITGTTAVLILAASELPAARRLWSQEAAGWASAIATFAAVLVALGISVVDRLERKSDRLRNAKILADAICDELRGVRWCLANLQTIDTQQQVTATDWARFRNALAGLVTPVLDRVHGDLASFEGLTGTLATRAYGNLLRFGLRWSTVNIPKEFVPMSGYQYGGAIRMAQEQAASVQERVEEAVLAVWPMTSWPNEEPFALDPTKE